MKKYREIKDALKIDITKDDDMLAICLSISLFDQVFHSNLLVHYSQKEFPFQFLTQYLVV